MDTHSPIKAKRPVTVLDVTYIDDGRYVVEYLDGTGLHHTAELQAVWTRTPGYVKPDLEIEDVTPSPVAPLAPRAALDAVYDAEMRRAVRS